MSDTTTPTRTRSFLTEPAAWWGSPAVAIFTLTVFLVAIVIAYFKGTDTLLVALLSVAATNATTAVNYYLGSSSGSQAKDKTIQDAQSVLANSVPYTNPNLVNVVRTDTHGTSPQA